MLAQTEKPTRQRVRRGVGRRRAQFRLSLLDRRILIGHFAHPFGLDRKFGGCVRCLQAIRQGFDLGGNRDRGGIIVGADRVVHRCQRLVDCGFRIEQFAHAFRQRRDRLRLQRVLIDYEPRAGLPDGRESRDGVARGGCDLPGAPEHRELFGEARRAIGLGQKLCRGLPPDLGRGAFEIVAKQILNEPLGRGQ